MTAQGVLVVLVWMLRQGGASSSEVTGNKQTGGASPAVYMGVNTP